MGDMRAGVESRNRRSARIGKRFSTRRGLRSFLIISAVISQLTACSGKTPVCLKPMGLTINERSPYFIFHASGIFLLISHFPPPEDERL